MSEALAILGFSLACIASYWVQRWAASESTDEAGEDAGCGSCSRACDRAVQTRPE